MNGIEAERTVYFTIEIKGSETNEVTKEEKNNKTQTLFKTQTSS
jgi:hypothetical protein